MTTTIDLIRHGEPVGGKLFRGWQDDPLSDLGWQQMRQAVEGIRPWQRIISSPLLRCAEFAQELSDKLDLPWRAEPRLREIGFGDWEGKDYDQLRIDDPEGLAGFWRDPTAHPAPGGETMASFQSRVEAGWQDLLTQHQGEHLLLVAHGGVNRLIIAQVLGLPIANMFRMEVPYAAVSRIIVDDGFPRLAFHCGRP
ncbi:MAG: alpha-ribazole phosphatase family protein [Chromatiales bacterium]|nr:alpha-ribazole phosphatase family protein [Chromatiales bacterium]